MRTRYFAMSFPSSAGPPSGPSSIRRSASARIDRLSCAVMDWNLRTCSRRGHVTYAPDEAQFRAKLEADPPPGPPWRGLRCGTYVLGEPHGSGPAEDAPVLLRGKALRAAFILRALAIERWFRGLILIG